MLALLSPSACNNIPCVDSIAHDPLSTAPGHEHSILGDPNPMACRFAQSMAGSRRQVEACPPCDDLASRVLRAVKVRTYEARRVEKGFRMKIRGNASGLQKDVKSTGWEEG